MLFFLLRKLSLPFGILIGKAQLQSQKWDKYFSALFSSFIRSFVHSARFGADEMPNTLSIIYGLQSNNNKKINCACKMVRWVIHLYFVPSFDYIIVLISPMLIKISKLVCTSVKYTRTHFLFVKFRPWILFGVVVPIWVGTRKLNIVCNSAAAMINQIFVHSINIL